MKYITLIVTLSILIQTSCFSQTRILEGHIIDEQGQQIRGFIQNTSNTKFCHKVIFSPNRVTKKMVYTPKEVQSFFTKDPNRKFKRFALPPALSDDKKDTIHQVVFAEILVETATRSLYYYQSKRGKKRLFIQSSEIGIKELIAEEQSTTQDGSNYQYVNKKYIGILKLCFKESEAIPSEDFSKLTLGIFSISKFFIKHCQSLKEEIIHKSSICSDKGDLQIILGIGASYVTSNFTNPPFPYITNHLEEAKPYVGTPAGVSFYYYPPFIKNTFFIGLNTYHSLKGSYSELAEARFKQHYLNIGLATGYQYPFGKVKPYLGAELTSGFLLNQKDAFISTNAATYGKPLLFKPNGQNGKATEVGFGIFAGIDIPVSAHGVRLEFKYHFGYMHLQSQIVTYHQHALQVQLQFRISTSKANK